MGRQAIYDAMCIRPEDEPSMTAFIASAGRRTYGKAIRDEAGALGYSLPATMPNDPYSLAAISDLAAHHAASIRAGYNPRLARAINALPDGTTDDQVRRLLQPFIDSTRIYNTDTLYPLLNARLRALGIGHFYDRNGIKSQYRIMPDESDYDDDCQADIDLGIVDSLDDFSRTDYPWHPHCFVAGTIIDGPLVHASFSRPYQGPIVTISTASGDKLTGTPNHPVLTTEGWVILGALHKGNNILRCIDARQLSLVIACWLGLPNPDEHQIPTKIEHLFAAPSMALFQVPCSTTHFHGDGMADGYVGIKYINCSLDANGNIRQFAKHVSNDELLTTGPTHGSLFRDGSLDFLLPGVDLASASVLSSGGLARALLRSLATRAKPPTFAGVTDCDSSLPQSFEHQPVTNPLLAGQINGRFAGIVTPDKIVNVRKEYGVCHVYNSSTHQGWFAANGFIVSNCGYDGQPHMIVRVNIDPQTLPALEELWDSTQGPVKSIIVIKEFDESQHPRDEHGRFTDGGTSGNVKISNMPLTSPATESDVHMIDIRGYKTKDIANMTNDQLDWQDVSTMQQAWIGTGGYGEDYVYATKSAVYEMTGLPMTDYDAQYLNRPIGEAYKKLGSGFAPAQYQATQQALQRSGVSSMAVARVVSFHNDQLPEGLDQVGSNPVTIETTPSILSSWTELLSSAKDYYGNRGLGVSRYILTANVPAERIFGVPGTGFVGRGEGEVVVIGGQPLQMTARRLP